MKILQVYSAIFLYLCMFTPLHGQISLLENGNIGLGKEDPNYPVHFYSNRNAHSFVFEQLNSTAYEKDVLSIIDRDNSGGGQDNSSVLKVWKTGTVHSGAIGFSLQELTFDKSVSNSVYNKMYWIKSQIVNESTPTWGVTLKDSNFQTIGGVYVGANNHPNGYLYGGTSALLSSGQLGLMTIDPQAELHVNGFVNRLGEQTPSDSRLKSNIQPFDKGLDEVLKLNPISFTYDKEFIKSDREHIGISAQEVQKLVPELVGTMELGESKKTKEKYLNIYDNEIKFLLINAIKEQQKMINELSKEVAELKQYSGEYENKKISLNYTEAAAILLQSRPNPNNGETIIEFSVPEGYSNARLIFYSMNGEIIYEESIEQAGFQSLIVNTKNMIAGRYTYSLDIDGELVDTKSMIVVK